MYLRVLMCCSCSGSLLAVPSQSFRMNIHALRRHSKAFSGLVIANHVAIISSRTDTRTPRQRISCHHIFARYLRSPFPSSKNLPIVYLESSITDYHDHGLGSTNRRAWLDHWPSFFRPLGLHQILGYLLETGALRRLSLYDSFR